MMESERSRSSGDRFKADAKMRDDEAEYQAYLDKILTFKDANGLSDKVPEILIDGMLREGELTMLAAHTKIGKSFLIENLAMCLLNGTSFLGHGVKQMDKVGLFDFESQENTIRRRLQLIQESMQEDYPNKKIIWEPGIKIISLRGELIDFSDKRIREMIVKRLIESGIRLFMLDPLYKVYLGKNENDNSLMALELNYWIKICKESGVACVVVDHFSKGEQTNKASQDRPVGAGSKGRSVDNVVTVTECKVKRNLGLATLDYNEDGDFFVVEIRSKDFPPEKSKVVEWKCPRFIESDLKFDGYESKAERSNAKRSNGENGRGSDKYDDEFILKALEGQPRGLTVDRWLAELKRVNPEEAPSRSTLYDRIKIYRADGKIRRIISGYILAK